ncbi:MAG: DNA-3-methyladenine glycosylase [Fidelibacterota bacterium]
MLQPSFYHRDTITVARELLGKIIHRFYQEMWLTVRIVETEAYLAQEKGSHAWVGITPGRQALAMPPGTIYMYYSRGGDSFNISTKGKGNAVLIKAGVPVGEGSIHRMQTLNPLPGGRLRTPDRLCSGQVLLCRSLGLTVPDWNGRSFDPDTFYLATDEYRPDKIIQTTRLGIPKGRDEHLPYRFIDYRYASSATKNPLSMRQPPPYTIHTLSLLQG